MSNSDKRTTLDASMQGVPVFTIAKDGKPREVVFQDHQVLMFFLDFDDAQELQLEQALEHSGESIEVFSLSLLDFLMFMQETQKTTDTKIVFKPHRNSINQLKIIAQKKKMESLPQMMIPLFFARSKDSFMSVVKDDKDVVPLFVDVVELKNTLKRNEKEDEMEIDVEFLESLLAKATNDESVKEQFMIIPSQCQTIRAEMLYRKPPEDHAEISDA